MFRITIILFLLWLPSLLVGYDQFGEFIFWRHQLTMLTGMLGFSYMCTAVLIASRFQWVESIVRGLDKGYAIHKQLGIGALVALILHWATIESAHWLTDLGFLSPPNRDDRPTIEGINWHGVAEQVGDISFKVFVIFCVISLVQAISYKKFKFTHKLGGILVIAGAFHSALLLDWTTASTPFNIAITLFSIVGVWCSYLSLSGKIGQANKSEGTVSSVEKFGAGDNENAIVRFSVKLDSPIQYKEGQFAYLNFHDGEAPHPFSILNYDDQSKQVEFGIKALGDYTTVLVNKLEVGQQVTIEGSYGHFQIPQAENQVWIGAGIGIVPFVSRLYWLQNQKNNQPNRYTKIDLFYCVNSKKEAYFEKEMLAILNKIKFVELHLFDAENNQILDGSKIEQTMAGKTFDVCFCGPEGFGQQLQTYFEKSGLPKQQFHKEIFKMR
ncbi:ferredoxin reductase family protein [Vibrio sp. RC27]